MNNSQPVAKTGLPDVVGAAIVDDLNNPREILAAARSYPVQWEGFFEFPGGKIKPGESDQQALRREIQEELGADIQVGAQLGREAVAHGGNALRIYLAQFPPGVQPKLGKNHLSLQWVRIEHADVLDWLPADYPFIAQLQELTGW